MKYLHKYNESKELYKEISQDEWYYVYITAIDIEQSEYEKIRDLFNTFDIKEMSIRNMISRTGIVVTIHYTMPRFSLKDKLTISFSKDYDNYYYVWYSYEIASNNHANEVKYYKCDDIDGIKSLLQQVMP